MRAPLRLAGLLCAAVISIQAAVVQPTVAFNGPRAVILKGTLHPGDEAAPADTRYDRVDVVISGTGSYCTETVGPGWARFFRAGLQTPALTAEGQPLEFVRIVLTGPISGRTVPAGLAPGVIPPSSARLVSDRVVAPILLVDNDRIRMVRWKFEPGEGSPIHIHALDHVYVVIRGSRIREITGDGSAHEDNQEAGRAAYSPARGKIHSFGNVGSNPYEMVSIELK